MSLKVYNTLSRQKEEFVPVVPGKVGMYVCGMTVYDFCHLGHARVMIAFDVIARYLRHRGYEVNYIRNITDIDDKIIRRARQNHLFERYVTDDPDLGRVIADCNEVSVAFGETVKKTTDPDKKAMQVIPIVFQKMKICLNSELKLFFDIGEAVQDPNGGRGEG